MAEEKKNRWKIVSQKTDVKSIACVRFKPHSSLSAYFDYWSVKAKETPLFGAGKNAYDVYGTASGYDEKKKWITDKWRLFDTYDAVCNNENFLHWKEYNNFMETIKPLVDELKKESLADILQPKFIYNDKGLGVFDFARASTVLLPQYVYYSIKLKKIVEQSDVKIINKNDSFNYILKSDKSEVVLLPAFHDSDNLYNAYEEIIQKLKISNMAQLLNDGVISEIVKKYSLKRKVYSTVKKSYLYKEDLPMPKKAIRLFCYVGGVADVEPEDLIWSGISTAVMAELLQQAGYSVSIIAVVARKSKLRNKRASCPEISPEGLSVQIIELKKFSESLNLNSLLLTTGESSFFRGTIFSKWFQEWSTNNDPEHYTIGSKISTDELWGAAILQAAGRDKHYVKNKKGLYNPSSSSSMLYYVIDMVSSYQAALDQIMSIILSAENENAKLRQKIYNTVNV